MHNNIQNMHTLKRMTSKLVLMNDIDYSDLSPSFCDNLDLIPYDELKTMLGYSILFSRKDLFFNPQQGLRIAASLGLMKSMVYFKNNGANNFDTSLIHAARNGHIDAVRLLINYGADNFNEALSEAASIGRIDIMNLCIDKGANDFNEALSEAASIGRIDIMNLCIDKGADNFNEALFEAASSGRIDVMNFCIDKGANNFNRALEYVGEFLYFHKPSNTSIVIEIIKILIEHGADVTSIYFGRLLYHAAGGGYTDIVKFLVEYIKVLVEYNKDLLNGALRNAAAEGNIDIVKILIENNADDFNYALFEAASVGRIDIMNLCIDKGANDFNRALKYVGEYLDCHKPNTFIVIEIIKMLIEYGADVTSIYFGRLLYHAACGGYTDIVKFLVEYNKDWLNGALRNNEGNTDIVKILIENNADNFNYAVDEALEAGQYSIVNLLDSYINRV